MENQTVLGILKDSESLLEGHFLLTSGKHSNRYCQCAKVLQQPHNAEKVISFMADQVQDLGATVVVGPAMGGIIVGYELAKQLGVRSIFAERENEIMTLRRGFTLSPNDKVIIAEDVVTTAKSAMETAKVIESFGANVIALTCIVDRRAPNTECPFPIYSATSLDVKTFEADNCPLCDEGISIEKPGSRKIV